MRGEDMYSYKRKLIIMICLSCSVISLGVIYWGFPPKQAQAELPCPANLITLTSFEERMRCGKEKHERFLRETQQDLTDPQNQERSSMPTAQAMQVTPLPSDKEIKELPLQATLGGPKHIQGATSFWRVGSVPDVGQTDFFPFLVWSKKGTDDHAIIGTDVLNLGVEAARYRHHWTAPRATGILTITNATGPDGTIQFQTSYGLSGTLELTTGEWIFSQ